MKDKLLITLPQVSLREGFFTIKGLTARTATVVPKRECLVIPCRLFIDFCRVSRSSRLASLCMGAYSSDLSLQT